MADIYANLNGYDYFGQAQATIDDKSNGYEATIDDKSNGYDDFGQAQVAIHNRLNGYDDFGQAQGNKSLEECFNDMLQCGLVSDVILIVRYQDRNGDNREKKLFQAHKYVLVSRSPVFRQLFCGHLSERAEVEVDGIPSQAFRPILKYLYTDQTDFCKTILMIVIEFARQYQISGLIAKCWQFFEGDLSEDNACFYLNQALLCKEEDYGQKSFRMIQERTAKCFKAESFLDIDQNTLSLILDSERLSIPEAEVLNSCLKWAKKACFKQKMEISRRNLREVLGHCINKFRFLQCEFNELAQVLERTSLLDAREESFIFQKLRFENFALPESFSLGRHTANRFACSPYSIRVQKQCATENVESHKNGERGFSMRIDSSQPIYIETLLFRYAGSSDEYIMDIQLNGTDLVHYTWPVGGSLVEYKFDRYVHLCKGMNVLNVKCRQLGTKMVIAAPYHHVTLGDCAIMLQISSKEKHIPLYGLKYSFFSHS